MPAHTTFAVCCWLECVCLLGCMCNSRHLVNHGHVTTKHLKHHLAMHHPTYTYTQDTSQTFKPCNRWSVSPETLSAAKYAENGKQVKCRQTKLPATCTARHYSWCAVLPEPQRSGAARCGNLSLTSKRPVFQQNHHHQHQVAPETPSIPKTTQHLPPHNRHKCDAPLQLCAMAGWLTRCILLL